MKIFQELWLGGAFSMPKHLLIVNPHSFRKRGQMETVMRQAEAAFQRAGEAYDIHVSRFARDAVGFIQEYAIKNGSDIRVYAVGGDGILFDCLNGMIDLQGAQLAAVPYGNENDFIRAFGENLNPVFRDISRQIKASSRKVDVIKCGNYYALNFFCVGVEALTILRREKMAESLNGLKGPMRVLRPILYPLAAISAIRDMARGQKYTITANGEDLSGNYLLINISNGPCYGGSMRPSPHAVVDDGMLNMTIGSINGILQGWRHMPQYISGHPERLPSSFQFHQVRDIYITSPQTLITIMDQEVILDSDIHVSVIPRAIRFVTPESEERP
jgi:YegS/Rv2252/BmrU family lipid kinase